MRIFETTGSVAGTSTGSLVLEHGDASGVSSIVFRSVNNASSDYAYIQYNENTGPVKSTFAFNLNQQYTAPISVVSTGAFPITVSTNDSSITSVHSSTLSGAPSQFSSLDSSYCIAFNQTNLTNGSTANINYLQSTTTVNPFSSSGFTLSAWIRVLGFSPSMHLLDIATGTNTTLRIYISNTSTRVIAVINDDITNYYHSVPLVINTWYHYAFTFNNATSTSMHYVNGVASQGIAGSGYGVKKLVSTNQTVTLGARNGYFNSETGNKGFNGHMSFVNLFDRPLSASDITDLYNSPAISLFRTIDTGLLTIGVENDTGSGSSSNDRISLFSAGGSGFVGVNTKNSYPCG